MANEIKWTAGTARTTGISSVTIASGANYLGSAIDNSTNKNRWMALDITFTCATATSDGDTIEVYVIKALDGSTYEDGDASPVDPKRGMDAVFIARGTTTSAQRQIVSNVSIPPFPFKILLKSELDQDATNVTLLAYTYDEEVQ